MDYSIKDYLNRLSIEELEIILNFCNEQNDEYKYIAQDVYQILSEKEKIDTKSL